MWIISAAPSIHDTSQYGPINGLLERDEEHDCERYGEYSGAMSHTAYGGVSLRA